MVCLSYAHVRSKGAVIGCVDFCQPSSTHIYRWCKTWKTVPLFGSVSDILVINYKQVHSEILFYCENINLMAPTALHEQLTASVQNSYSFMSTVHLHNILKSWDAFP